MLQTWAISQEGACKLCTEIPKAPSRFHAASQTLYFDVFIFYPTPQRYKSTIRRVPTQSALLFSPATPLRPASCKSSTANWEVRGTQQPRFSKTPKHWTFKETSMHHTPAIFTTFHCGFTARGVNKIQRIISDIELNMERFHPLSVYGMIWASSVKTHTLILQTSGVIYLLKCKIAKRFNLNKVDRQQKINWESNWKKNLKNKRFADGFLKIISVWKKKSFYKIWVKF